MPGFYMERQFSFSQRLLHSLYDFFFFSNASPQQQRVCEPYVVAIAIALLRQSHSYYGENV